MESYSQLREAAKQIIARVAGRLSGVRLSGLMDPAVTGLERAAVVANTPITFRPRELLGVSRSSILRDIWIQVPWKLSVYFHGSTPNFHGNSSSVLPWKLYPDFHGSRFYLRLELLGASSALEKFREASKKGGTRNAPH